VGRDGRQLAVRVEPTSETQAGGRASGTHLVRDHAADGAVEDARRRTVVERAGLLRVDEVALVQELVVAELRAGREQRSACECGREVTCFEHSGSAAGAVSRPPDGLRALLRSRSCTSCAAIPSCIHLQRPRPTWPSPLAVRAISSTACPGPASPRARSPRAAVCRQEGAVADLGTEERARSVDELAADDDDLLAVEELLRHDRGKATKEVALAIDHDRCGRLERHLGAQGARASRCVEAGGRRRGEGEEHGRRMRAGGTRARGGSGRVSSASVWVHGCSSAAGMERTAIAA